MCTCTEHVFYLQPWQVVQDSRYSEEASGLCVLSEATVIQTKPAEQTLLLAAYCFLKSFHLTFK